MKKLLAALLMLCLLSMNALAEMDEDGDIVVTLPGMEFFFTPMEGYCLTRESSASLFNQLGMSQRTVIPWMEEYDVYALLYDEALTMEVQIAAYETIETDFDEMTSHGEEIMCADLSYGYTDQGYEVEAAEIYNAVDGHKFVRIIASLEDENGIGYLVEYLTCQAGYTVSIILFPYDGHPTEKQLAQGDAIADSMWITEKAAW